MFSKLFSSKSKLDLHIERIENVKKYQPIVVYHKTNPTAAASILRTQKMKVSSNGQLGKGIYFCENPIDTHHKARLSTDEGVILKCIIKPGKVKQINYTPNQSNKYRTMTFDTLIKNDNDSIHFISPVLEVPYKQSKRNTHKLYERVIYNTSQIVSIKVHWSPEMKIKHKEHQQYNNYEIDDSTWGHQYANNINNSYNHSNVLRKLVIPDFSLNTPKHSNTKTLTKTNTRRNSTRRKSTRRKSTRRKSNATSSNATSSNGPITIV